MQCFKLEILVFLICFFENRLWVNQKSLLTKMLLITKILLNTYTIIITYIINILEIPNCYWVTGAGKIEL